MTRLDTERICKFIRVARSDLQQAQSIYGSYGQSGYGIHSPKGGAYSESVRVPGLRGTHS